MLACRGGGGGSGSAERSAPCADMCADSDVSRSGGAAGMRGVPVAAAPPKPACHQQTSRHQRAPHICAAHLGPLQALSASKERTAMPCESTWRQGWR